VTVPKFLPGVPAGRVLERLENAGGKEIASGKLSSSESSAALAVNCFGWFIERPEKLPSLKGFEAAGVAELVDVEFCARFPWSGGRHPWLDAVVQTPTTLIGIESKRFEPFRDKKSVRLSKACDRAEWGPCMKGYERMRDCLRAGDERFVFLDATQLVKHAFGLVTEGRRRNRMPVLFYLFAEPAERNGRFIALDDFVRHRQEIARFAAAVAGDEVAFQYESYREWIDRWRGLDSDVAAHGQQVLLGFAP
jgi:hypothetical protein